MNNVASMGDVPAAIVAVDIGNTKVAVGVADEAGRVVRAVRFPTRPELGVEPLLDRIFGAMEALLEGAGRADGRGLTIGVAFGGLVSRDQRVALISPNFPGWSRVPLVSVLEERYPGALVAMDNDAKAAALGQALLGSGRGFPSMLYVTVSTGVGGALVLDGHVVRGAQGAAGEIGHTVLDPDGLPCSCGARGCLEAYVSGPAILRRARVAGIDLPEGAGAEAVFELERGGHPAARAVVEETARYMGLGLANAASAYDPDAIVLGGGVMHSSERLLPTTRRLVAEHLARRSLRPPEIRLASSIDDAGLIGAVALALQMMRQKRGASA